MDGYEYNFAKSKNSNNDYNSYNSYGYNFIKDFECIQYEKSFCWKKYVEKRPLGKVISFYCNLWFCRCNFSPFVLVVLSNNVEEEKGS